MKQLDRAYTPCYNTRKGLAHAVRKEVISMLKEKVEQALEKVRPALQADGGDVKLVDVDENGVVKVKLTGACGGCPMSQMTLKMGIEKTLKLSVPEVTRVESV
jgi:Fe-S cluster biogenesis protein NfuA